VSFARRDELTQELGAEYRAIRELFENYEAFGIAGGAILVNGCVQAYAVGEALSPNTAVCHFEKAATDVKGLAQLMNQWFAANTMKDFEYLNREQDLGVPGLRQANALTIPTTWSRSSRPCSDAKMSLTPTTLCHSLCRKLELLWPR